MKTLIAIGGGEIRHKTTLKIDEYIAQKAKAHAGDRRAIGLFVGTASHDSMPYFNSFRKTYTSVFDIKADVALSIYGEMDYDHVKAKFEVADFIYIGGGDTKFMLESWARSGLDKLVLDAYHRGVVIAGLSAGAICWFQTMYSDYDLMRSGEVGEYKLMQGMGVLEGTCSPHYNDRRPDFQQALLSAGIDRAIGIENDCAVEFCDGVMTNVISAGGKAFRLTVRDGIVTEEALG